MNRRSFAYFSIGLFFLAASDPACAQQSKFRQSFSSLVLQSAVANAPPPGINAIQTTELIVDVSRPLSISEYEQSLMVPDATNAFINSITALGITYTVNDLTASLNKLRAKNVQASKAFLDNLLLADVLLNEMRKNQSSVVAVPLPPQSAPSRPDASASRAPFNLGAIEGTYRYEPYSNAWQEGTLEPTGDFRLKWTNKANISWGLTADLQTGVLRKDEGSPYQDQPNGKEFIIARDAMGNVTGFQFCGSFYKKQ